MRQQGEKNPDWFLVVLDFLGREPALFSVLPSVAAAFPFFGGRLFLLVSRLVIT